jgi:hypothetical protein
MLTLDDGSGRGLVRMLDGTATFEPELRLGEVVNVTGTVATRDVGGWEIVASADGLVRAAALGLRGSTPAPTQDAQRALMASPVPGGTGPALEDAPQGSAEPLRLLFALTVGVAMAALVMLAGGLAVAHLRRRARRPPGSPLDAP